MAEETKVSGGKRAAALILDILIAVVGLGYVIALLTGGVEEGGFTLTGTSAFLWLVTVVLYFAALPRLVGRTIGKMIVGIPGKK